MQAAAEEWGLPHLSVSKIQAMKEREVEHVRYRRSRDHETDAELQATLQGMRVEARAALGRSAGDAGNLKALFGTPDSACVSPEGFVNAFNFRSLGVTRLEAEAAVALRGECAALLERFPDNTLNKVGRDQLSTEVGKAKACVQLVGKHGGEVVEIDRSRGSWVLRPAVPGSASAQWGGGAVVLS